jgi:hypothetical protein
MKTVYSLLTLLSTSLVVAAPAPFVGRGPVVAARTENVAIPVTNFGRREAAIMQDLGKRALRLRGALIEARTGQGIADVAADPAAVPSDPAQAQAKGKDAAASDAADQKKKQDAQVAADKKAADEQVRLILFNSRRCGFGPSL